MSYRDVGGTPGGLMPFLSGFVLACAGAYLLLQRVTVSSGGGWFFYGYNAFGLSLVPFFAGIVMLAYNGSSWAGRLLVLGGLTIIFAGIIMNLQHLVQSHQPLRYPADSRTAGHRHRSDGARLASDAGAEAVLSAATPAAAPQLVAVSSSSS